MHINKGDAYMTLRNNEDGIRIATSSLIQSIGNLLNGIDRLHLEENKNDNIEETVQDIQSDLISIKRSFEMVAHDVDCMCSDLVTNEK